jgi:L-lactate dehydrogenase (cytochrome)
LQHAGHDATKSFQEIHNDGLIEKTLSLSKHVGFLNMDSIDDAWKQRYTGQRFTGTEMATDPRPSLSSILSTHDFEKIAQETMPKKAWAFYSSAADDLVSKEANRSFYSRIWFRPRLMRDVTVVSTRCQIQGVGTSSPIMVAPAALAKLAHETGEKGIARAAASKDIIHCVSFSRISQKHN